MLDWNTLMGGQGATHQLERTLVVEDGAIASAAILPDTHSIWDGLQDYAAQYDAGAQGQAIKVRWEYWHHGNEIDSGAWLFTSRR